MRKLPIFVVFLLLSAASLGQVRSYNWVDTQDYLLSSQAPIFSEAFLAGRRAPLFPLVLKMVGGNLDWLYGVQVAVAVGAFVFLTLVLWPTVKTRGARILMVGSVLALGLSSQVACWNYAPLSESLSNSLSVVLIALAIRLVQRWKWSTAAGILFTAALWVATRDANGFELLAVSGAVIVAVVAGVPKKNLVFVGGFLLIFLTASYSSDRGRRWMHASWNLLVHRVLPDAEATKYFTDRGMPMTPLLMQQKLRSVSDVTFYQAPQLEPFRQWWTKNGRRTYAFFLATHPGFVLKPLLRETREMYGQNMRVYESEGFHSTWRQLLSYVAYPESWALGAFLVVCLLAVSRQPRPWWRASERWIPLSLVALGLAMGLFNQHCDAREVARHATHTNLHLRLGVWLLLAQSLDAFLQRRQMGPFTPS